MFHIIKPGTKIDFMGQASRFAKLSAGIIVVSFIIIFGVGVKFGLDFSGGHEILLRFEQKTQAADLRSKLEGLFPDVDTAIQRFEMPAEPTKDFFLVRIERSESLGQEELSALEAAFKAKYGEAFKRLRYNPEAGDVVQLRFNPEAMTGVDTSEATLKGIMEQTKHDVRVVRRTGRPEQYRWEIQLKGVDVTLVNALKEIDPGVTAVRVEFVGPTVGQQLRNQGILAVVYALLFIMVYIAFRFDFFYSPGAVLCLAHDAVATVAFLAIVGEQFTLATIAGLLTLVGYSINDTIVIFDRIRETIGNTRGAGTREVINRALNDTLGRTIMTSGSTLIACICLIVFGSETVLASFGMIMTVGLIFGTYSSIYIAAPVFMFLRERYGSDKPAASKRPQNPDKAIV